MTEAELIADRQSRMAVPLKDDVVRFHTQLGELCVLRLSQIMCLFPDRREIRTIEHGWTLTVHADQWERVMEAFLGAYEEL